jgi:threonine dehydrogenase-like Zn-dependent dehydrogenase
VLVGAVFPTPPVPVVPERLVRGHLTVRGVHNYAPGHLLTAVRFLAEKRFPFETLVADWFPLHDAESAFRRARAPDALRVGVRP